MHHGDLSLHILHLLASDINISYHHRSFTIGNYNHYFLTSLRMIQTILAKYLYMIKFCSDVIMYTLRLCPYVLLDE